MEKSGPDADSSEAKAEGDDPHVLNAGVGQKTFDIFLPHQEDGGGEQGEEAEGHQDAPPPTGVPRRTLNQGQTPEDSVTGGAQKKAREDRGNRGWRLAVGVGKPVVKGGQTGLCSVPNHKEKETGLQEHGVERGENGAKLGQEQHIGPP